MDISNKSSGNASSERQTKWALAFDPELTLAGDGACWAGLLLGPSRPLLRLRKGGRYRSEADFAVGL